MDEEKRMQYMAKWIIRIFCACILIYLGIRYIGNVAGAVVWVLDLLKPLLIGLILALVLNVPMSFIEQRLLKKCRKEKVKRPVAIALSIFLVIGLIMGITILIVPELVNAVLLITQIVTGSMDQLAAMENGNEPLLILGDFISKINIDWMEIKEELLNWLMLKSNVLMEQAVGAAGSAVGTVVTFFLGGVFSVYVLAQKEKLIQYVCRLIRVWIPEKTGNYLIHAAEVCGTTFRLFIAGQATEALILGVLCLMGMLILRIPYAPMIGALIGMTALIPLFGAWIGTIVGAVIILSVSPFKAFVFVIFIIVLQQIEGNVIYPRTVGAKIKLPALMVLAAVTIGGRVAGPLGMLLGVPLTSAVFALLKEATARRESQKI